MALPRALAILLVTALFLSGCSGGGGAEDDPTGSEPTGDEPTGDPTTGTEPAKETFDAEGRCAGTSMLSEGDFWAATTTAGAQGTTTTATTRMEVEMVDQDEVVLSGTSTSQGVTAEVEQRICPASLGLLSATTTTTVPGFGEVSTTTSYDPPCNSLDLPVEAGQRYMYTCHATSTNSLSGQTSYDQSTAVEVGALEAVTVPAGTFQAFRIEVTMQQDGKTQATQTWWYAAEACNVVKITGANPDGSGSYTYELTNFECAKA